MMRTIITAVLGGALLLTGCRELDVSNPNEPDRTRVLSNASDVESLISTQMVRFYRNNQFNYPNGALGAMVDNITGGFFDFSVHDLSTEPRSAWNNSSLNTRSGVNEQPWYGLYDIISSVSDGLAAIDAGMVIEDAVGNDNTPRARAFGKIIQGLAHGYLGLLFDKALVITEDTDLEQLEPTAFLPYEEVIDSALALLDEGIAIAQSNSFVIPGSVDWINGQEMTSAELIRLANSYAARLIANSARTWEERQAVDWNEVIRRIDAGITEDFAPSGLLDSWESDHRRLLARVRTLSRPGDHWRMDYYAVGPADVSGGFQTWATTPSESRQPFQMNTPDRRVQGPGGQSSLGKYFGYNRNSIWAESRGTYRWSWYYYLRSGQGESWYIGPQPTMTVIEMNLLKAEALIRLGRAAEAVPLINASRVTNGELPPVTVDGPPQGPTCVPRQIDGDCGSLWDAWKHEVHMEMAGIEGQMIFYWLRGNGQLQEGTSLHFPPPGRELENLGLAVYTYGGASGGGAPAPLYHRCPVALPRCE